MGTFAWGPHIEGAVQMVKARGRKQLRTQNGLVLFIAVRTQMVRAAPPAPPPLPSPPLSLFLYLSLSLSLSPSPA